MAAKKPEVVVVAKPVAVTPKPSMPAKQEFQWVPFLQDLMLGGTSGVIAKTVCAPLERIKIILQLQATQPNIKNPYTGILNAARRLPQEQGFASFWRGNFTNCLRYFPTQAIGFATKERYQKLFVPDRKKAGFAKWFGGYLLAGGAAGATALTVCYPLEFAYTRLAADVGKGAQREFSGLGNCFVKVAKKDGFFGMYKGFIPSIWGIVVYRAGYFGFYDISKQFLFKEDAGWYALPFKFALALCVDIASSLCAFPLDTVRRSMMMQAGRPIEKREYTSMVGCFKTLYKTGGMGRFYKGAFTNCVRAIASALVLVLYDELKKNLIKNPQAKKATH